MVKEYTYVHKNVDLSLLANEIERFFHNDGFSDVIADKDPNQAWFDIQARKIGVLRTIVSSRKTIHVIIKGEPNNFKVFSALGEWGKNIAVAAFATGTIGLIGIGLNVRFQNKLWSYIKSTVEKLENTAASRDLMGAQQPNVVFMQSCPHCNGQTNEYYGKQYCHNCKVYV